MFKLKNFKILLLLTLFVISAQNAWGGDGYWMYMHIQVDSYPTGAGKVYASTSQSSAQNSNNCVPAPYIKYESTAEANINSGKTLWYINTTPVDATKWAFVGWVKNASDDYTDFYNTSYISTDRNPTNGFNDPGSYASSTANGKGGKVSHSSSTYYLPDPFPITLRMTAVYKSIKPDVIAVSNNGELGATDFTDANNSVGETVVLSATPAHYNSKFEGWYKNNVLVSKENPYSFTVTNENKGTYTARFVEHKFMRIKNNTTNRYINGINDVGSITNFSSLQLESNWESTRYQAGTVVYMWDYTRTSPSAHPYVFDIQGFSSKEYYDDTGGVYVIVLHNNEADTWTISSSDKSNYMADKGASSVGMAAINAGFPLDWKFEHIDNDLETCENYFSLDPAKLVEVDGKYYTTLRTSWNILFNPDQMTPYVVTSVDEEEGTFEMQPITGNIIPLNTPVIIETKSNDIEENRMVPTKTNEASGAVPSGNLLKVSTKYFPNQDAPVSNCRKLMKNADGELAFGGDALSKVNGNEAYLSVSSEVVLKPEYKEVTLAQLVSSGKVGSKYRIKDGDIAAIVTVDQNQLIVCKDDNKYANPDEKQETWYDYIHMQSVQNDLPTSVPATYDQSNWIGLRLPNDQQIASTIVQQHQQLTDVRGVLTNKDNPELLLDGVPKANGMASQYSFNVYVAPNFYGENHQTGDNGAVYFFVQPKPMEPALVEWLIWDGNQFVTPPKASYGTNSWNQANLKGSFDVNFDYIESGEIRSIEQLIANYGYRMPGAIVRLNTPSPNGNQAPRRVGEATKYVVYPLVIEDNGSSINDDGVITDVARVVGQREVTSTEYYNVAGIRSDRPWQGVNIVVMRYSDGTTSASKMLR